MFERFTGDARRAVVRAKQICHDGGRASIGTIDLLLSITEDADSPAAELLSSTGVDVAELRRAADPGPSAGTSPPIWQLPFANEAKRALERALRASLELGHRMIGPEHILLALVRGSSPASRALAAVGAELEPLLKLVRESAAAEMLGYAAAADALARAAAAVVDAQPTELDAMLRTLQQALESFRDAQPEAKANGTIG